MVNELFEGRVVVAKVLSAHSTGASLLTVVNGKAGYSLLTGWMHCDSTDEIQVAKFSSLRDGHYILARIVEQRGTRFTGTYVPHEKVQSALSYGNVLDVEVFLTLPTDVSFHMEETDQQVIAIGIIKGGITDGYEVYLIGGQKPKAGDQLRCSVHNTSNLFQPYVIPVESL